jgi:hypothetical protein
MRGLRAFKVTFTLGDDLFTIYPVTIANLGMAWDVSFGGAEYAKTVGLHGFNSAAACTVKFNQGVGNVYNGCRSSAGAPPK